MKFATIKKTDDGLFCKIEDKIFLMTSSFSLAQYSDKTAAFFVSGIGPLQDFGGIGCELNLKELKSLREGIDILIQVFENPSEGPKRGLQND